MSPKINILTQIKNIVSSQTIHSVQLSFLYNSCMLQLPRYYFTLNKTTIKQSHYTLKIVIHYPRLMNMDIYFIIFNDF